MVNYEVLIQKRYHKPRRGQIQTKFSIFFALIDVDRRTWPANYICELPKTFRYTNYNELFPDSITNLSLAKELLNKAIEEYTDMDIQREIRIRLSKIENFLNIVLQKNHYHVGAHALTFLGKIIAIGGKPIVSFKRNQHDSHELCLKPQVLSLDTIQHIAMSHNFNSKEDNGTITIF